MATYSLSFTGPTRNINTDTRREILRFPTCAIPSNAIKITNISLQVTMRHGSYSSSKYITQNFKLSNTCNTSTSLSGWSTSYLSSNNVYYQTTGTSSTYFNATYYNLHFPATNLLLDSSSNITISATGNQSYTFSFTPTTYGSDPANWRNNYIYLGSYQTASTFSSTNASLWGTNTSSFTITLTYTENTAPSAPTIVYPAAAGKTTYNTKPWFRFKSGSDAESTNITTYWRVDNGTWQSYSGNEATNTDKQWTTTLSTGSHTVYAYSSDGSLTSSTVSRTFTVATPISAITVGTLMDDAVIDSLQTQINNLRAYYGLTATTFTTINAGTKAIDDHIDELETAFEATPHKTDVVSVNAGAKTVIANINNLRTGLLNG